MPPSKINLTRNLERNRLEVEKNLLPDTCQIFSYLRTSDGAGGWDEQLSGTPLLWRGLFDIPCRLDPTAHYRGEEIFEQERLVNEYTLWLPHDAPVEPDHVYRIGSRDYQVIRLMRDHSKNYLVELTVNEVS